MKILFGADAVRYPLTGIGRYAYELGSRLPDVAQIERVMYFRDGAVQPDMPVRPNTGGPAEKARLGFRRWAGAIPLLAKVHYAREHFAQQRTLRKLAAENTVYHGPNFYLPASQLPSVATFHDLSIFAFPECHPASRVRHMSKELPLAIRRSRALLTVSEFTRQEVAAYFSYPLDRIVATPLAASPQYYPMSASETAAVLTQTALVHGC